jgi:membrane fusion protein, multidrug efflux system
MRTSSFPTCLDCLRTLVGLLLLGLLIGCAQSPSAETSRNRQPGDVPVVSVSVAELRTWERTVQVHGTLLPDEFAVLGAKVPGRIAELLVDVGSVVRKGQALARLDHVQLELEVRHAEALLAQACAALGLSPEDSTSKILPENSPVVRQERALLDQAKLALVRANALRKQSVATQEDLDEREAAQKVAAAKHAAALNAVAEKIALIEVRRSEVAVAQNAVAESTIVAPFDGVIQERSTAAGAYVRTGDPVVSIARCDRVRLLAAVPEKQAHLIEVGQKVHIRVASEDQPIVVEVSRLRPLIDPTSRALMFEADVPNPDCQLKPGLFARADVVVDPQAQSVVIPESAVVEFAGIEKVWRIVDGEAQETVVQTGPRRNDHVVVLSGVNAGDAVITDGTQARTGKVKIENNVPRS